MKALLYLFFILLSLGQLIRITPYPSISILGYEFVMLLIILVRSSKVSFDEARSKSYFNDNVVRAWIIFLEILLMTLVISLHKFTGAQNLVAGAYLMRLVLYCSFFFSLSGIKEKVLQRGIHLFTGLTIFFSFLQYIFFPRIGKLVNIGWDPHEFRVFGTFLDVTPTGIIFTLLSFYYLVRYVFVPRRHLWSVVTVGFLFLLILLTYSRITYIGFVCGLIILMLRKIAVPAVLGIAAGFILGIFLLPSIPGESTNLKRTFSIEARYENMQKGIAIWKDNRLFGVGYNQLSSLIASSGPYDHADSAFSSSYVTILASAGIVGLLALIFLFVKIYLDVSLLGKVLVSIVAITSLFENVFLVGVVLAVFLSLIALEDNR